jgi:hypothetical protein
MMGILGSYLLAIIVSPLIIEFFAPKAGINPFEVIKNNA